MCRDAPEQRSQRDDARTKITPRHNVRQETDFNPNTQGRSNDLMSINQTVATWERMTETYTLHQNEYKVEERPIRASS